MYLSKSFDEPLFPVIFSSRRLRMFDMSDMERPVRTLIADGVKPSLTSKQIMYSVSLRCSSH